MTKPTFTIYDANNEPSTSVTGKASIKAYMVLNGLSFVFVVRDDGQAFNVTLLRSGRCTLKTG